MERPAKRRKPDISESNTTGSGRTPPPSSLTRSITPPSRLRKAPPSDPTPANEEETGSEAEEGAKHNEDDDETSSEAEDEDEPAPPSAGTIILETPEKAAKQNSPATQRQQQIFKSPFQLTKIRDYPPQYNIDTVTLSDLLGDPLISECWEFNYLHDIDFLMNAFDPDTRHLVKVHVVHGFWKQEDLNRLALQEAASRYQNVTLHSAFMPEMFGTHHSKMMILLRHDDTAQIVIHTANLIVRDWGNMTQAVWRSPLLPLVTTTPAEGQQATAEDLKPGSGERFKVDFLNYLASYNKRRPTCRSIAEELQKYDFSSIRGCLIASVPGRHNIHDRDSPTRWGWAAVKEALKSVPLRPGKSEIAIQISSIATLGPTDKWLRNTLFDAFSGGKAATTNTKTVKGVMGLSQQGAGDPKPEFKIIFPTADEIRASLDGYNSGGSIHTKISSAQQKKQLVYLKPLFYHWGVGGHNEKEDGLTSPPSTQAQVLRGKTGAWSSSNSGTTTTASTNAGRDRAAPHIKTYIRYSHHNTTNNSDKETAVDMDWALVTSANLSKQAWGEGISSSGNGEIRIASYEIGVLVWPQLFAEGAVMRGAFLRDSPPTLPDSEPSAVVGLRMPYSLPLRKYGKDEIPWVATASYDEPDWKGQYWRD